MHAVSIASGVPPPDTDVPVRLRRAFRVLAFGIAALHTIVAVRRQSMNEDGINYLDMGAAYMSGDWQTAINGIWSPLYSWIVGGVVHVARPSVWWEFPVVQMTNFGIFAVAVFCFEFFWRRLTERYYSDSPRDRAIVRFPPAVWFAIGYSLFIWSSLNLIEIWAVTPDMSVAALVYVAAGMLLRLGRSEAAPRVAVLLGVALGVGYLAKAVLFPLGILCILLAGIIRGSSLAPASRVLLSLGSFAIVAAPLFLTLSVVSGRVTFGDVSRFTYLKHVNGLDYPHWGETLERVDGAPQHAPRRIFESPDVYEFAEPTGGTYPLSFDPSYWTEGLLPRIEPAQQFQALIVNGRFYFDFFVRKQGAFLAVVLLLVTMAVASGRRPLPRAPEMVLVLWGLSAFGLYALVYAEERYIAPFVVLVWSGTLACVSFPDMTPYRRLATSSGMVLALAVWVNIGAVNLEGLTGVLGMTAQSAGSGPAGEANQFANTSVGNPAEIASGLLRLGVRQGDRVGVIGYSFGAFWARLARVRIVAEMARADVEAFWNGDPQRQSDVLHAFASAGATAVVAQRGRGASLPSGWHQVGKTDYLVRFVR